MAGYSGTPLPKKLGIRGSHRIAFINAPENYTAADLVDQSLRHQSSNEERENGRARERAARRQDKLATQRPPIQCVATGKVLHSVTLPLTPSPLIIRHSSALTMSGLQITTNNLKQASACRNSRPHIPRKYKLRPHFDDISRHR
jgi:hypothetical protein